MLPEYEPTIEISNTETAETTNNGKSFLFDFATGDFVVKDGNIQTLEGKEALKIWIEKVLRTEKDKYKAYIKDDGTYINYGTNIKELIEGDYPQMFLQAEIQREITEALLTNNEILSVDNFNFTRSGRILNINFNVSSIYGTYREEVII